MYNSKVAISQADTLLSGFLKPSIISTVVVFPAPLGSSKPKICPTCMLELMPSTAFAGRWFLLDY